MPTAAFIVALHASLVLGQAAAPPTSPPTPEEIAAAIVRLGDDTFAVRQEATQWLWHAGMAAEPQLRAALKSTDPEVRTRAASVLDKVRFGLKPDTPPDVAVLIDQFRHGGSNIAVRRQALAALQAKGQWSVVLTLLRGETDESVRRELANVISADAGKLLRPLLAKGDLDQAEQILELTALNEAGLAQLAAFLLLSERLEPRIEALRQRLAGADPQPDDWRRLAMFLRAKGDFSAAADAAGKANDLLFAARVLAESRRFGEAAKAAEEYFRQNNTQADVPAFAAAYFYLAGDEPQFERVLGDLRRLANLDKAGEQPPPAPPMPPVPADPFRTVPGNPQIAHAWRLAETLLTAERVEPALEVLKKTHPLHAHALLVRQHRPHDALEYVKVTADQTLDRAWLDSLPAGLGEPQLSLRINLAAQVARELRDLGRREQAEQIAVTLRTLAATAQGGSRWTTLAALYWQLDRYDEAFAALEQALASNIAAAPAFNTVFKKPGALAAAWFIELTSRDPQLDRKATIAQAAWLVHPQPPAGKLPANWRDLIQKYADQLANLPAAERSAKLLLPAEICRLRGDLALARKVLGGADENHPAAAALAADLAAAEGDWPVAAAKYGQLAAGDGSDPLYLFLQGYALTKAGQAQAGSEKMRLASLTALAPDVRYLLAKGLQDRGWKEPALEQFELVRRTWLPDNSTTVNAAQQVGNLVTDQDPARAADCWRQLHLYILSSLSNFIEPEGYLTLPQLMHKARARSALAGKQAEALAAELDRCEQLLPGDVRLVTDLAAKLDGAGLAPLGDKILERGLAAHQRVLKEFPESPLYLNNAAWICARAQRQLDEGLALAERAVKVAPDEASYQDTLAEIHFQRGDRDAAVAAARKALELSPERKLFVERLKHFQNSPVKTLDTSE